MNYFLLFISAMVLSMVLTVTVRKWATTTKLLDVPRGPRKIHKKPIPLFGGFAIYASFFAIIYASALFFDGFIDTISIRQITGVFIASTILMVGGYIDDRHDIGYYSLFFVLAAVLTVLPFDIGVTQITNPFGGVFSLDWLTIPVFSWGDVFYTISLWVDVFTIAWLLSMTYATKLLDGLDGLVSGLLLIGSFVIFLLSTSAAFLQPEVAMLAITLAGASLGFLIFNWNPASIFLGEGGSVFAGFMLGILAIISGGKIATALLIMGIPLLDLIWVIGRRLMHGKSIVAHDAQHVHHRLLKSGFTQKQAVIILYTLSFSFGITTLFLQSMHKLVTLGVLVFVMILLGIFLVDKTE